MIALKSAPIALLLLGLAQLGAVSSLAAEGWSGQFHYISGDIAPGTGDGGPETAERFSKFSVPKINDRGDIAFIAELQDDAGRGIWFVSGTTGEAQLVAMDGETSPVWPAFLPGGPTLGLTSLFGLELYGLDDEGRVYFESDQVPVARSALPDRAIHVWEDDGNGGQHRFILATGYRVKGRTLSPGNHTPISLEGPPYVLGTIDRIQVSSGGIVTAVGRYGPVAPYRAETGIWTLDVTTAQLTSELPTPVFLSVDHPDLFTSESVEIVVDTGTEMGIQAWLVLDEAADGDSGEVVRLYQGATPQDAKGGDSTPGLAPESSFTYLGRPAASETGNLAFWAETDDDESSEGIWVKRGDTFELLAAAGAAGPAGITFSELSDPVINQNGLIAFKGEHDGGEGIWIGNARDALLNVVATGATATGRSGEFSHLGSPVLNDRGQMLFQATVDDGSGARVGSWVMTSIGCISPIMVAGDDFHIDPFDVATVTSQQVSDLTSAGNVAAVVELDDGRCALISIGVEAFGPTSYEQWAEQNIADPSDRDPDADPDGDRRNNRAEFAFGTDPESVDHVPTGTFEQEFVTAENGDLFLQYSVTVRGVGIEVERSPDLAAWFSQAADLEEIQSLPVEGGFQQTLLRQLTPLAPDETVRFSRLRVTAPE